MKRRISVEQLQELTDEQKQRLREWWLKNFKIGDVYVWINTMSAVPLAMGHKEDDDFWDNSHYFIPLLDIGQMIELLESKIGYFSITNMFAGTGVKEGFCYGIYKPNTFDIRANNLCDELWQAVKSVLADKKE